MDFRCNKKGEPLLQRIATKSRYLLYNAGLNTVLTTLQTRKNRASYSLMFYVYATTAEM